MAVNVNLLTSPSQFVKAVGGAVAVTAFSGVDVPPAHAAGSDVIQIALVGCGGHGSGAIVDALKTTTDPITR